MPLKDLLASAIRIYKLSGGTRKVLESLEAVAEANLPQEIINAQNHKDLGSQVTKNILSILVCVARLQKNEHAIEEAIKAINNLVVELQKTFESGWFASFSYTAGFKAAYVEFSLEAKSVCEQLNKQAADEKAAVKPALPPSEIDVLKEQLLSAMKSLEKSKEAEQQVADQKTQIQDKLSLTIKENSSLIEKNSQLQKENMELKKQLAEIGNKSKANNSLVEELASGLIADWALEKIYGEIVRAFSSNEAVAKLFKEPIDLLYKKYSDFYHKLLDHPYTRFDDMVIKQDEKATTNLKALVSVHYYNHSKRDLGFFVTKAENNAPHTPTGKSTHEDEGLEMKIKNFCEKIKECTDNVKDGTVTALSIYLRRSDVTKMLVQEYAKNKMQPATVMPSAVQLGYKI